jgi:hypothetical protein
MSIIFEEYEIVNFPPFESGFISHELLFVMTFWN